MKPLVILLIGIGHDYVWQALPNPGVVRAMTGALFVFALLLAAEDQPGMGSVCMLLALYQTATLACNVAYLISPWPAIPGVSCTAIASFPLAILGALLALYLVVKVAREQHDRNSG